MPEDSSKVPKDPYPLIDGFEWVTMDMNDKTEVRSFHAGARNQKAREKQSVSGLHALRAPRSTTLSLIHI